MQGDETRLDRMKEKENNQGSGSMLDTLQELEGKRHKGDWVVVCEV